MGPDIRELSFYVGITDKIRVNQYSLPFLQAQYSAVKTEEVIKIYIFLEYFSYLFL